VSDEDEVICPHCGDGFETGAEYLTHAFAVHYLSAEEA
jgi:hypothetical protein